MPVLMLQKKPHVYFPASLLETNIIYLLGGFNE